MEVADLEGLAEAEVVDIDDYALGNFSIDSAYLDLLHGEVELTTGLDTLGVAFELDGHLDGDGLLVVNLEEVDVEDVVLYGVEVDVLEDSVALLAVDVELDSEDVGSIDELANVLGLNYEIGSDEALGAFLVDGHDLLTGLEGAGKGEVDDSAAVENNGDEVGLAEVLGSLLAQVGAGLG